VKRLNQEVAKALKSEIARWKAVIEQANIPRQ